MKTLLIILLLIFIVWQTKECFATQPEIHIVSGPNTARTVTMHYAPWCHACKNMRPVWDAVKSNASKDIKFVEINGDVTKTPGVVAYPTIQMICDGKMYQYHGGANYQRLYQWVMNVKPGYVPEEYVKTVRV